MKATLTTGLAFVAMTMTLAIAQGCASEDEEKHGDKAVNVSDIPGHEGMGIDARRTQGPRTMAAEVYLRSYMNLFGLSNPEEIEKVARGSNGRQLFETWADHLAALGLPDYSADIARAHETNALMLGAYERLGMALCERAVERDLRPGGDGKRTVFNFTMPADPFDRAAFDAGFDSLHRTVLGYPAKLAPATRGEGFFKLYSTVVSHHGEAAVVSKLSPQEAGWAIVCQGLVRHPEFHLY